jgi:S-adenosylmethionine hydrolase
MRTVDVITFLSDFGWGGGYVAACEASIVRLFPSARVLHISHEVPAGDISTGALVLARVASLYPEAIHLAVVDPGVGTSRRPIVLCSARGDLLIGPDNGLLIDAAESLGGITGAWALDIERVRVQAGLPLERISTTFHGRDLFAPASALLAAGADTPSLGRSVSVDSLIRPVSISAHAEGDRISAPVIEIDRFGNIGLGLPFAELPAGLWAESEFLVNVPGGDRTGRMARMVKTFAELPPGQLGLIRDSWGQAALTLYRAAASEVLGARLGMVVTLAPIIGSEGRAHAAGTRHGGRDAGHGSHRQAGNTGDVQKAGTGIDPGIR